MMALKEMTKGAPSAFLQMHSSLIILALSLQLFIATNNQCVFWFITAANILVSWLSTKSSIIMMFAPRAILPWEMWHIQRHLWNICFQSSLLI